MPNYQKPGSVINLLTGTAQMTQYDTLLKLSNIPGVKEKFVEILTKKNAFVFHRSHVERFFNNGGQDEAEYLMVVFGIKEAGGNEPLKFSEETEDATPSIDNWEPTVIILGCNTKDGKPIPKNITGTEIVCLKRFQNSAQNGEGEEASEHPDGHKIEVLPGAVQNIVKLI